MLHRAPQCRRRRRRGAPAAAVAVLLLLVAAPPAALGAFPTPGPLSAQRPAEAAAEAGCLAGVPDTERLTGLPGTLSEATSIHSSVERDVDLDRDTAMAVMALAPILEEPVDLLDVLTYREERVEVCTFDRLASLEGEGVMNALALGVTVPQDSLRELVVDQFVVVRFESVVDQRVELDKDVAFAALALHGSGIDVRLGDVIDIERSVSTKSTLEVETDLDRREVLLALALSADGGSGFEGDGEREERAERAERTAQPRRSHRG